MDRYSQWYGSHSSFGPGMGFTKAVRGLIAANIAVFILVHLLPQFPLAEIFGLVPRKIFLKLMLWQLVTYMFVHLGLWHLVLNMLMLWFFGPVLEASWGRRRFLTYYFFTGIGAGLTSFIFSFSSPVPVVGASGAIFGILVAYALTFPETVILLFFIFPMKVKHAVYLLGGVNLLGALSSPGSGIAYLAHLGGGLSGYLYLKNEWISSYFLRLTFVGFLSRREGSKKNGRKGMGRSLNQEVDRILDKVSKKGVASLTDGEKAVLERKSREK